MPDGATMESRVHLTDSAARRVTEIRDAEGNAALMLRLTVLGGGCSGFQYKFDLDDTKNDDDLTFENGGVQLVMQLRGKLKITERNYIISTRIDFIAWFPYANSDCREVLAQT